VIAARAPKPNELAGRAGRRDPQGSLSRPPHGYEIGLDGITGEVFVIDNDLTSPLAVGTRIIAVIAPGSATLVPL